MTGKTLGRLELLQQLRVRDLAASAGDGDRPWHRKRVFVSFSAKTVFAHCVQIPARAAKSVVPRMTLVFRHVSVFVRK